ncbi:glycosyltransferase family 4 protein [Clostridium sp. 'White wine YQ']|uniref:glycosyltransferase family 4 protein n=1 Tax=Clostridium sp. 'White wine YQ' TaxID=3027474 RepID=UPI002366D689|nr:glycosyltransferase family 1 protein [Clostridium sp. 'White wine YQ']MDD7792668.1 glycosyltransferase family 1 protein [Clostridium sp. 'White wine YQ']
MRIGIDGRASKWYRGTGIGTYTYELIYNLNLIDTINDYFLFLPENSSFTSLNKNFTNKKVDENPNENFWENVSLPNIIKDNDLDLYHIPQNGVGLPTELFCKSVITLHDIIPLRMPETVSERYKYIFYNHIPKIIDNVSGIITVSEFSKEDIAKEFNYPKDRIYVTPLAAENIYKPLDKNLCKSLLNKYYSINKSFILYVGGFSPRKNIVGLLESFSKLKEKYKHPLSLVITGKHGISYEIYKNKAISLNIDKDVLFPGFIPMEHMPIFYNSAEMLVYPSFYEGFGLPPLESMACGTPVIASNSTSIPEILQDSAILINPQNINEIIDAMYNFLINEDLKNQYIVKGFSKSKEYNWKNTAIQTLKAYTEIYNS